MQQTKKQTFATHSQQLFFEELPTVCGSARLGAAVLLTIRGFQFLQQHILLYFLLLFVSYEAIKPLSTSLVIERGHIYISVWVEEGFHAPKYFLLLFMVRFPLC